MISHFPLYEALPNTKLQISKHNKRQIPLQNYDPIASSVEIKLEHLPLNSPKLIW